MRKFLHSGVEGLEKHTELVLSGEGVHGGQEGRQRRGKSKKEGKANMRKLLMACMSLPRCMRAPLRILSVGILLTTPGYF